MAMLPMLLVTPPTVLIWIPTESEEPTSELMALIVTWPVSVMTLAPPVISMP